MTSVQRHRGLSKPHDIVGNKRIRDFKTIVTALVGAPGTGKSRLAKAITDENETQYYKKRG